MSPLDRSIADLRNNDRQWEAFCLTSHGVVLAPPGSGKTKLLTTRMAHDLRKSTQEKRGAACVTLTNAAAVELRDRLAGLGATGGSSVFVGTVHSFVLSRIIKPFALPAGEPHLATFGIATALQDTTTANDAIRRVFGGHLSTQQVNEVRNQLGIARQQLTTGDAWGNHRAGLDRVAQEYEQQLTQKGLIDFLGLIAHAVRLVEGHPVIRSVLNTTFPRVYVDEYQDLAPGLDRLVRQLCLQDDATASLFAVGDPDQAVFAFTGTRPELLDELRLHPKVTAIELDRNYRSGQGLIDLAGHLRPGRAPVRGTRNGGQSSAIRCNGSLEAQISTAVQLAISIQNEGVPLHEIAVLCPQNSHCDQVAEALRTNGLRATARERTYRLTRSTRLIEDCAVWAVRGREISGVRLRAVLAAWRELLGSAWQRSHEVRLTAHLLRSRDYPGRPVSSFVDGVLQCRTDDPSTPERQTEDSNELLRLVAATRSGNLASLSTKDYAERVSHRDRIHVTTMTLCKGLEFDAVIVIGLDEEIVPYYLSLQDTAMMAEDRRKFYVSITRARESLYLLYSGVVRKPWGDDRHTGPSRFLREIRAI